MTAQSTAQPNIDDHQEPQATSDAWVPTEPGEKLEGVVESVEAGWSDYHNGHYPILRVTTADGDTRAFHAFRKTAFNQILDKRPTTGERITITYLGARAKKEGATKNPAVGYRIVIHGRDAAADRDLYARIDTRPSVRHVEPDVPIGPVESETEVPF